MPPDERPLLPADARALDMPCRGVTHDSRRVEAGWVFVALRGLKADGVDFAPQAIAAGAAAIVADRARTDLDDGAVDRRQGRAAGAGVAGRGVLRTSEPRDAGRRHHRDQRQDDDRLPGERDLRGGGHCDAD